jgi:hypothetical protein
MDIRLDDDGRLDEIVSKNCTVHLEKMDKGHWWMAIHDQDGGEVHIEFFGREVVSISPTPDRSLTLREAVEAGQICPSCSGVGHYLVGNFDETCSECEGTGQI